MGVQLLTVAQVATRLEVHEDTVRRMIVRGDLQSVKVARCVRIPEASVEAYVFSQLPSVSGAREPEPASDGQIRALHAKCSELDKKLGQPSRSAKKAILLMAGSQFGREIKSSLDLTSGEAHWVLEKLDSELDQLQ